MKHDIKLIECTQGTPEWFQSRAGIVTASELSKVLAKGEGKTRMKYMRQLAGEIITGKPADPFKSNAYMEAGKENEAAARELLATMLDEDVTQVGFIRNSTLRLGCSPDGLLGEWGKANQGVEIKCCLADIQIERLLKGGVPSEYVAQVEGSLLASGLQSWHFYSYSSGLPAHIVEVTLTDERRKVIEAELAAFNKELDDMVQTVRGLYA